MLDAFRMFARYNRVANERLYDACSQLDRVAYRQQRSGSFGSIYGLLNHMLLGDRIWMSRFAGGGKTTPPLNSILFEDFAELRVARVAEDAAIEAFFAKADQSFLTNQLSYTNSLGKDCLDVAPAAVLHFFNHQTHHRGQAHGILTSLVGKAPELDLLFFQRETGIGAA
jgi:uncharacterized damage-inducible protein DinB